MQMIKNNNLKLGVWPSITDQWESGRCCSVFSAEVRDSPKKDNLDVYVPNEPWYSFNSSYEEKKLSRDPQPSECPLKTLSFTCSCHKLQAGVKSCDCFTSQHLAFSCIGLQSLHLPLVLVHPHVAYR